MDFRESASDSTPDKTESECTPEKPDFSSPPVKRRKLFTDSSKKYQFRVTKRSLEFQSLRQETSHHVMNLEGESFQSSVSSSPLIVGTFGENNSYPAAEVEGLGVKTTDEGDQRNHGSDAKAPLIHEISSLPTSNDEDSERKHCNETNDFPEANPIRSESNANHGLDAKAPLIHEISSLPTSNDEGSERKNCDETNDFPVANAICSDTDAVLEPNSSPPLSSAENSNPVKGDFAEEGFDPQQLFSINYSEFFYKRNIDESPPSSSSAIPDSKDADSDSDDSTEDSKPKDFITAFQRVLIVWALLNNVNHTQLTSLLQLLKTIPDLNSLPATAKTLLRTPRKVDIKDIDSGGQYYHFGIEKCLKIILRKLKESVRIELLVNIDGFAITNSNYSTNEIWPILCSIYSVEKLRHIVFPVGFFYNRKKPTVPDFLKYFVKEMLVLLRRGITVNNIIFPIYFRGLSCDAPARSLAAGIIGHTGYGACTRCKSFGKWLLHRVSYHKDESDVDSDEDESIERSHAEAVDRADRRYFKEYTPLVELEEFINLVNIHIIDIMHAVYIGVTKTTLELLRQGNHQQRLSPKEKKSISEALLSLKKWIPSEFARTKPRPLEESGRYKATEARQLVLYTCFVVLKDGLADRQGKYTNFISLAVAMRILLSPEYSKDEAMLNYASELITFFNESFAVEYGDHLITFNYHSLTHLVEEVKRLEDLEAHSAFKYENFLQYVDKLVRKHELLLEQCAKRMEELYINDMLFNQVRNNYCEGIEFKNPYNCDNPLPGCSVQQYQLLRNKHFTLTTSRPNNCCEVINDSGNSSVILVFSICFSTEEKEMGVTGFEFLNSSDFFDKPLRSSIIGIKQVSESSLVERFWPISKIKSKNVLMPYRNVFVSVPMLHEHF